MHRYRRHPGYVTSRRPHQASRCWIPLRRGGFPAAMGSWWRFWTPACGRGRGYPACSPAATIVESTDGLTDCDGRGTAVAGLIAGQPSDDGFAGIAPGARLVSLRVTSGKFSARSAGGDPTTARAIVDVTALGPGDRACRRPRRAGDHGRGDHLPARRPQRRPGRTRRGHPIRGRRQGRRDRRRRR